MEQQFSSVQEQGRIASWDLRQEIIVEILLRLPVQSLLRFKCVSKSWFSEISSPQFAKKHFNVSSKNKRISNCRLLCFAIPLPYICSFDEQITPIPLDPNFTNWGCCNGWICYSKEPEMKPTLWNPSTRKFLHFRRSDAYKDAKRFNDYMDVKPFRVKHFLPSIRTAYGFGYDELTDDYKVIEVIDPRNYPCTISIYSVRRNYWKRLKDCHKTLDEYCYLLNGALHWEGYPNHNGERSDLPSTILSINLSTEAYQELDFPQHEQLSSEQMETRIGLLRDCLCASFNYFFSRVDVWIMKEYGMKESWYKLASIPHISVTGYVYLQRCVPPIWMFENGEILLIHECKMKSYNPRDGKFKMCFISDDQWRKRNTDPNKNVYDGLHKRYGRPECYVQSLMDLP